MAPARLQTCGRTGGFTLVELLVATTVFVIGFVAVYALFLAGMRFRKLSDDVTRTATLASTVLTEMYLDSANAQTATSPAAPRDYNGRGTTPESPETAGAASGMNTPLYTYPGIPGTVYRFSGTTDLLGNDTDVLATAVITKVVALCPGTPVASYQDLNQRTHLIAPNDPNYLAFQSSTDQATFFENTMVAHGVAMSYNAVIIRQPHWMY